MELKDWERDLVEIAPTLPVIGDAMVDTYTVWGCIDCTFHYANGECGSCHNDHGHDREPLSLPIAENVTMGMLAARHDCLDEDRREDECDCEVINFSHSSCELCGSHLYGERHAFTVWD